MSSPYTADVNTVHLFHFDEAAAATTAANAVSGAPSGIAFDGDPSADDAVNPQPVAIGILGADGSFTIEALVNLPSITSGGQIISTDNSLGNGSRGFQFRVGGGDLEFNFIATGVSASSAAIPGGAHPQALVSNHWFHVAVSFDGPSHTSRFYWTRVSGSSGIASLIGTSAGETTSPAEATCC